MTDPTNDSDVSQNPYAFSKSHEPPASLSGRVSYPLAVGLFVVLIAATLINVGFGIGLAILTLPAYIRAATTSLRKASMGQELSTMDRVLSFFASFGVVLASVVAGWIGLFVTCCGVLLAGQGFGQVVRLDGEVVVYLGIGICFIGFFAAAGIAYWLCWPKRPRK